MPEEVKEEEKTTDAGPATQEKTLKVMCLGEDLGEFTEGDTDRRLTKYHACFSSSYSWFLRILTIDLPVHMKRQY